MSNSLKFSFLTVAVGLIFAGCGNDRSITVSQAAQESAQTAGGGAESGETAKQNLGAPVPREGGAFKEFAVYKDANSSGNHYAPSGWMGDYGDIKYDGAHFKNPHSGTTCIQIIYNNKASQGARWVGIYWQNPPNNWGTRPGGYDLRGAKKLTFWVRGEKGGERIEEFKIGGITGEYPDTDVAGIGPVLLTQGWKQYTIDLKDKELSSISGGFCWATNLDVNPEGATFYLDDIVYE